MKLPSLSDIPSTLPNGIVRSKAKSYVINSAAALAVYGIIQLLLLTGLIDPYFKGLIILVGINAIMAVSLNLATGLLGELCLGHAGFMAVGAYAAALFTKGSELPPLLALIIGLILAGIVAAVTATLVGIPALRLRGDYLAIITLAFGEIISIVIRSLTFTGGARGLNGIPLTTNFTLTYVVLLITIYAIYALIRSRHGRAILAIREDDIAAEASGINSTRTKITAFVISAAFAGLAGGLYAHYQGILAPERFNYDYSINFMVMVVFGGMGSITGSILAATVLTFLPELMRDFSDYRMLIYAVLLIVLVIFRPSGLLGREEISQMRIKRFMARILRRPLPPLVTSANTVFTGQRVRRRRGSSRLPENLLPPGSALTEREIKTEERLGIDSHMDEPADHLPRGQR